MNEAEQRTYRGTLQSDGALSAITPLVEQGGESLAEDFDGNVYLAAGQVYIYSSAGKRVGMIKVPERPHDIVFGGRDGRTLYILTDRSLYSARILHLGLSR